jgi:large subunit ribosomal protein L9
MKVILLRDVAKVGRKAQVCEVPSGHAANFLIPRKLAVPATPENMRRHAADTARRAQNVAETVNAFAAVVAALRDKTITYKTEANAQGHLFKGVHASDISRRLSEEGLHVPVTAIKLPQPIKTIGVHAIALVQGSVEGVCTLEIVA